MPCEFKNAQVDTAPRSGGFNFWRLLEGKPPGNREISPVTLHNVVHPHFGYRWRTRNRGAWLLFLPENLRSVVSLSRVVPAVVTLRHVWIQNYTWTEVGTLRWRTNDEIPASAQYLGSPYDLDAGYSQKCSTSWVGYKVHLTESCDADLPLPITNVETTIAITPDDAVTAQIHASLKQRDLLPDVHLTDMGYIDAELLVESERQYQLDLLGPVRGDYRRQGQENKGFAAADFVIDWDVRQARCPAGCTSVNWNPTIDLRENPVFRIKFAMRDCQACAHRSDCTDGQRRCISIRPRAQYEALQQRRKRQRTQSFKDEYAKRAPVVCGILACWSEGTLIPLWLSRESDDQP